MNESRRTIERILQTEPTRVSDEELDGIGERMLYKLHHSNPDDIIEDRKTDGVRVPHRLKPDWWKPVAAAVLIGMVASGVYALRVQRASTPKVALPAAQRSVAGENTQVAATSSESRKPGTAPSRGEALARAAARIAAAQATDAGAARPKFAVASVRPVPISPAINYGLQCLGVDGSLWELDPRVTPVPARRGRCSGQVVDLRAVVHDAYATNRHEPPWERMVGFPANPFNVIFQIEAVADDPEHVTKNELKLMLQTLLEDRFKARVHLEMREVDGYVLTIGKSGIKFKETSVDTKAAVTPSPCLYNGYANRQEIYVRGKCGMEELTSYLSRLLMLPVADKTGLMGIYNIDFVLEAALLAPTGGGPRGAGGQQARQFTTPVPKALEEQLGLHVERGKAPAEFVVVDHIEEPTPN